MDRLATTLCGIGLKNPVLAASAHLPGVEFRPGCLDLNELGGFVVKGLSREPMAGNPRPAWEAEAGMMNSIGLQNIPECGPLPPSCGAPEAANGYHR